MITSFDDYLNAKKQWLQFVKTTSTVSVATAWFSVFDNAGNPGAGVLAVGNTANGQVPTRVTNGFPFIENYAVGAKGYLSRVDFGSALACRFRLIDRLFHCGAYAFNDNVILAAQPDFSSRLPNGSYNNLALFVEVVVGLGGAGWTVTVIYTNKDGVTGRTTGAVAIGTATSKRVIQLGLQAGDNGIQKIEQVICAGGASGTVNFFIGREIWSGRVRIANDGDMHALDKTGLIEVFQESALQVLINTDGTSTSVPELRFEIAEG